SQDQAKLEDVFQTIKANGAFPIPGIPDSILGEEDFEAAWKAPDGWAGVDVIDTQVAICTHLTAELKREGKARDVVRHVQDLRKTANLQMEDRIVLYLHTGSVELRQAIEAHREYIINEPLCVEWATRPLTGEVHRAEVKIDGEPLLIALRKVS